MLVLMDIDQTMLASRNSGLRSMVAAGTSLFGEGFHAEGMSVSGRIDPLLVAEILTLNSIEPAPDTVAAFRRRYAETFEAGIAQDIEVWSLPGVTELLAAIEREADLTLGVLTGNFEETGTLKLNASGIGIDRFVVRVWGDDSPHEVPHRDHLPGVAIERYRDAVRRDVEAGDVLVVGDTVHDVRCAQAHDCRSLAVATGHTSAGDLRVTGADLVVEDLTDTDGLMQWITRKVRA